MSLFPKVFTLHRLLLLSTPSPPSRLFKLDDESSCAVAISSASRWARLCIFGFSSTLNLKWCGYWMCARFTTLKIGVLWLYTDIFPEGKQTHYQKSVWKGNLSNWSNKCARRSPSEASLVFRFSRRVCACSQSCRSFVRCERQSAESWNTIVFVCVNCVGPRVFVFSLFTCCNTTRIP